MEHNEKDNELLKAVISNDLEKVRGLLESGAHLHTYCVLNTAYEKSSKEMFHLIWSYLPEDEGERKKFTHYYDRNPSLLLAHGTTLIDKEISRDYFNKYATIPFGDKISIDCGSLISASILIPLLIYYASVLLAMTLPIVGLIFFIMYGIAAAGSIGTFLALGFKKIISLFIKPKIKDFVEKELHSIPQDTRIFTERLLKSCIKSKINELETLKVKLNSKFANNKDIKEKLDVIHSILNKYTTAHRHDNWHGEISLFNNLAKIQRALKSIVTYFDNMNSVKDSLNSSFTPELSAIIIDYSYDNKDLKNIDNILPQELIAPIKDIYNIIRKDIYKYRPRNSRPKVPSAPNAESLEKLKSKADIKQNITRQQAEIMI